MKRENLKRARQAKGLNQKEAAIDLGIHVDHIRSLEYGRVNPSSALLLKICNYYGERPEDMFPDLVNSITNTTIV